MTYIICEGDPTSTGGTVTQGHPLIEVNGKPGTLVGMIATCPACNAGEGPIKAVGPRDIEVDGVDIALDGDQVECGCPPGDNTVIASQTIATGRE